MKNSLIKSVFAALFLAALIINFSTSTSAQTAAITPELSVAELRIGDEESAKKILQNYSPRYDNELNQPKYFFYNNYGDQVMTVTAHSKERPLLIVGIEVFAVGKSYQKKHFQMEKWNAFITESGFFIGERQSATSLIFALPNVTRTGEVIRKKGQPNSDEKTGKVRTLRYRFEKVEALESQESKLKDVDFTAYTAEYRFYKNRLTRFSISVAADAK